MEEPQVVLDEVPVESRVLFAGCGHEERNIMPIADRPGSVVGNRLGLQADDILDRDYRQLQFGAGWQAFRALQHAEAWPAKRVENVNPTPGGIGMKVMGNILGVEIAPVAGIDQDAMGRLEVLQHEDE